MECLHLEDWTFRCRKSEKKQNVLVSRAEHLALTTEHLVNIDISVKLYDMCNLLQHQHSIKIALFPQRQISESGVLDYEHRRL